MLGTALNNQPWAYKDCTDDNFPAGVISGPTMTDPPLDWMLANKNGLGVWKLGAVLAAHEAVEIPF